MTSFQKGAGIAAVLRGGKADVRKILVPCSLAVYNAVGAFQRETDAVVQDKGVIQAVRCEAYFHLHANELCRCVKLDALQGDAGIVSDLTLFPVQEAFLQPFAGLGDARMVFGSHKAVNGTFAGHGMDSGVVLPYIIFEHTVEVRQRGDLLRLDSGEPAGSESAEVSFDLALGSTVPDRCVCLHDADGTKDQHQLFVPVNGTIVHVELIRDAVSEDGIFQDLLVVVGIVAVEDFTADNHAGVIIKNHDQIGSAGSAVFPDKGEVGRIRLPEFTELCHFKGKAFPGGKRSSDTFEVVGADKALHRPGRDCGGDKTAVDESRMNGKGSHAGVCLLEAEDFCCSLVTEGTGCALIPTFSGHEGIISASAEETGPLFKGIRTELSLRTVWQYEFLLCYAAVVGSLAGIGKSPLDDRRNDTELKVRHFDGTDGLIISRHEDHLLRTVNADCFGLQSERITEERGASLQVWLYPHFSDATVYGKPLQVRLFVSLKEGKEEAQKELPDEADIGIQPEDGIAQEAVVFVCNDMFLTVLCEVFFAVRILLFPEVYQCRKPEVVMSHEPVLPVVQGGEGDMPVAADLCNGTDAINIGFEHRENKQERIGAERDQDIRKDGMIITAAAFAHGTGNHDAVIDRLVVDNGCKTPAVGRSDLHETACPASLTFMCQGIEAVDGLEEQILLRDVCFGVQLLFVCLNSLHSYSFLCHTMWHGRFRLRGKGGAC